MSDEERKLRGASQKDCTGYELQRAHSPHVEAKGRYAAFFMPISGKRPALCPTAKHTVSAVRIRWSIPKEEVL